MKKQILTAIVAGTMCSGAALADHTSTVVIDNGRATVSNFLDLDPTSGLMVNLNMGMDTLNPATGNYDMDIPAAGTNWSVYADGYVEVDLDGDGIFELSHTVVNELVDSNWTSPGFSSSWFGNYVFPIGTFAIDTTPYGGPGVVTFGDATATLLGADLDNPATSGAFGDNAFADIRFDATSGMIDLKTVLSLIDHPFAGGNGDGKLNWRFNTDMTFTMVPAPASAALLGLGGLVAMRRRR